MRLVRISDCVYVCPRMRALLRVCVRVRRSLYYAHINACVGVHNHSCEWACSLVVLLSVYVSMRCVLDYVCDCVQRSSSLFPVLSEFLSAIVRACGWCGTQHV